MVVIIQVDSEQGSDLDLQLIVVIDALLSVQQRRVRSPLLQHDVKDLCIIKAWLSSTIRSNVDCGPCRSPYLYFCHLEAEIKLSFQVPCVQETIRESPGS